MILLSAYVPTCAGLGYLSETSICSAAVTFVSLPGILVVPEDYEIHKNGHLGFLENVLGLNTQFPDYALMKYELVALMMESSTGFGVSSAQGWYASIKDIFVRIRLP